MSKKFGTNVYAPIVAGIDTADDLAAAYGDELGKTIHHFLSISDRDGFSSTYKSRLFHSWCVVKADENGFAQWYEWNGTQEDGSDGAWVELNLTGVVMSDSSGAIPKNIKTVVFGPGFAIQQAGDQEDAALVTYTGSGSDSSLTVSQDWGNNASSNNVDAIQTLYPIQVNQNQIGSAPLQGNAALSIDPKAYEVQHGNACLVKLDMVNSVAGQKPHAIYMAEEVVPTGMYFQLNPQAKGIDCQDNTGGDTAETGGQMTEVLVQVAFLDAAPEDGNVKVWLEYKDPSDPIDKKILLDVNGNPLAVEKQFTANTSLDNFVLAGAFMAKATQPLKVMVEASFNSNTKITLDPLNTMLCLNQFSNGYETSVARIEFLRRAAIQITPAIQEFNGHMLSLANEIEDISVDETITAGTGTDTLNEFGVQNLTEIHVTMVNGEMTLKDVDNLADYYVDTLIDNTHTRMLRGKSISSTITLANPNNAFEFEAYSWNGKPDHVSQVYSKRTDGSVVINSGWVVIKGIFIAEQSSGSSFSHTLTFDVPDEANNILILVRPQAAQTPSTLTLSEFEWGSSTDFTGYVEIERYHMREEHLRFSENFAEFFLNNQGYGGLRYTINNTPTSGNPMPVGKLAKGKAPVEIDNTVNQVSGSADPQNDGAIKFLKDGEASISKSYNVWNEQGTDNTVTFWDVLIDTDGNETKIPESEKTFTIRANQGAPGTVVSIPAYAVDVETGQRIGGRATSNKKDGVYVQSVNASEYIVQTIIDFKELVPSASDSPDLISAPLDKKLVVDRRVHPFTGNQSQNVVITNLDIPSDIVLANVTAEKELANGFTSIESVQHAYNKQTNELTVHVGSVNQGILFLEFWG